MIKRRLTCRDEACDDHAMITEVIAFIMRLMSDPGHGWVARASGGVRTMASRFLSFRDSATHDDRFSDSDDVDRLIQ